MSSDRFASTGFRVIRSLGSESIIVGCMFWSFVSVSFEFLKSVSVFSHLLLTGVGNWGKEKPGRKAWRVGMGGYIWCFIKELGLTLRIETGGTEIVKKVCRQPTCSSVSMACDCEGVAS